jgi:hypothetical protein
MSKQGRVNITGQWEVAVRKVQEALAGADPQGKSLLILTMMLKLQLILVMLQTREKRSSLALKF